MRIFLIVLESSLSELLLTLMTIKCDCWSCCGCWRIFTFDLSCIGCITWFSLLNTTYDLIELCSFICLSAIWTGLIRMIVSFCAIEAMRRRNFLTTTSPIRQSLKPQWDLGIIYDLFVIKHTHAFIISWSRYRGFSDHFEVCFSHRFREYVSLVFLIFRK